MKTKLLTIALAATCCVQCAQQPATTVAKATKAQAEYTVNPDEIISLYFDDDLMREAKAAYNAKDPDFMSSFNPFLERVERDLMNMPLYTVTDNIKHYAPSGDPRDYITLSPYWFPDPDVPDGKPYVRSDGVRNPEVNDYPGRTLGSTVASAAESLAFTYFITENEKYAEKAAALIRKWYLDPEVGQNPNLNFAQYVPGMTRLRGTGLLESSRTVSTVSAAKLMEKSQAWTDQDEADLQDWATAYLYWMEYSTIGQEECRGGNNHAMWYEAAREAITLYVKDYDHLANIIVEYQLPRLSEQVAADSLMPHELARTKGLQYHVFTLEAVNESAIMAAKLGIDVWGYKGANGRGMTWPLEKVSPYWVAPETWPYMQITEFGAGSTPAILYQAGKRLNNQQYIAQAEELGKMVFGGSNPSRSIQSVLYYKLKS